MLNNMKFVEVKEEIHRISGLFAPKLLLSIDSCSCPVALILRPVSPLFTPRTCATGRPR